MADYSLFTNDEEIPSEGILLKKSRAKSKGGTLTDVIQPGASVLPNARAAMVKSNDPNQLAVDLYQQGSDMYQKYLDKNEGAGEGAMLNALAAQFAGEGFQPLQAQLLKKAGSAEDTMAKKAEFLLKQAQAYQTIASNADTAKARIDAQRAQNDILNQLKVMGLNIQQQGVDLRAEQNRFNRENANQKVNKAPPGYRYTEGGDLEFIPGGPADLKSQAERQRKAEGATDVETAVGGLRDAYDRLEKGGGITSTNKGALSNLQASASSSGLGQTMGRAFGTTNQSARNDIAMARPALLAALMKATGMSAKQMDSNAELKLWLSTATDPTLDVESNRKALNNIERKYLGGQTVAPAGGGANLSSQEAAELEALRKRFGGR